ncbi:MAG: transglycosylase domain-containing protein [Myxococcales bacterium]|nr:transglycosylase domain-containing protein [Myxococcales bacterium]
MALAPSLRRHLVRALRMALMLTVSTYIALGAVVRHGSLVSRDDFAARRDALPVLDRHGQRLTVLRAEGVDARWVGLAAVSPNMVTAVLAAEDRRFFSHDGLDRWAVLRALTRNVLPGARWSGASTLTQQTVKMVYGRRHGVLSKLVETLRAFALERTLRKDEILEQYLNRVPMGNAIEGVARASEAYFGHPASTLSLAEAALLAAIPQAPSATEPRGHLARALRRQRYVLEQMARHGLASRAAVDAALRETLTVVPNGDAGPEVLRFAEAAADALRHEALGPERALVTSLDARLQREVTTLARSAVTRFAPRGASNGAAVVVANDTGEIVAYVGAARWGASYPGGALDLLRVRRQPGSTMKPFVYGLFFEAGGHPGSVLADIQERWRGRDGETFLARDYDRLQQGPVRAREALASSLNLAALDAAATVGATAIVARLRAMGVPLEGDARRYGEAAVIGGVDVSALTLARMYAALARGGDMRPLRFSPAPRLGPARRVFTPESCAMLWDVLSDPQARRRGFGADLQALAPQVEFALKTGTSSNWRDAWAAVSSRRYTVVVWLGDPAGHPMASVSGFEAAAPAAVRMLAAAERIGDAARPAVASVRLPEATLCAQSGHLAGPSCHHVVTEHVHADQLAEAPCAAHDAMGRWQAPARYAAWIAAAHPADVVVDARSADGERLQILEPRAGATLVIDGGQAPEIPLVSRVGRARTEARWSVDGVALSRPVWTPSPGQHRVTARDDRGREDTVIVTVRRSG